MRISTRTITVTVILLLSLVSFVSAQTGMRDRDRVRAELERTDQIIERARELIANSNYAGARIALEASVKLQNEAWEAFDNARINRELAIAKRLTLQARQQARRAVSSGHAAEDNVSALQSKLERTTEMLSKARSMGGGFSNPRYQSVLDAAADLLDRAWEMYRDGQYRAALKLVNQAEETARKVVNASQQQQQRLGQLDRQAELIRDGLDRIESSLTECQSEVAGKLMEQAREAYRLAVQLRGENRYGAAIQSLKNARKLAEQAARECRGGQSLTQRYDRLAAETDRMSEQVMPADDQARKLLDLIREQLDLAKDYLDSGDTKSATAAMRAAELTLGQLKRHLGQSDM